MRSVTTREEPAVHRRQRRDRVRGVVLVRLGRAGLLVEHHSAQFKGMKRA